MAQHEHTLNIALGQALDGMRRRWEVRTENLGLTSAGQGRPDILITEAGAAPLVIEHESAPAASVEEEARSRLGMTLRGGGVVRAALALRSAVVLRGARDGELAARLAERTDFEYALFREITRGEAERWPARGWLRGGLRDLALLAQQAMRPSEEIDKLAEILEGKIDTTRAIFTEAYPEGDETVAALLAAELRLADGPQTRRMAMAILANALIFQQSLAPQMEGVRTPEQLYNAENLHKTTVLDAWEAILRVNYYPIFHIAQGLLRGMDRVDIVRRILEELYHIIEQIVLRGATRSHHLVGFIFQRLIADRKFLATFYTRPESAALLAALALPEGERWADAEHILKLRVADFACGTGTLLAAVQQRLSALHELHGGDSQALHRDLLERVLGGADVLPMAVHLMLSMLAAAYPEVIFSECSMLTMPYGKQETGEYALGSLDLLASQMALPTISTRPQAVAGEGEQTAHQERHLIADGGYDLVIMNPPFTRPTHHGDEHDDIGNPVFAAFGTGLDEQRAMADKLKTLGQDTPAHGLAGMASYFVALADRKIRPDGRLAMVLPQTILAGSSWRKTRAFLAGHYSDIIVVTLAGEKSHEKSFSEDTGMGECLLIARKCAHGGDDNRACFITLHEKPRSEMEGLAIAHAWENCIALRRLEDGPFGGTPLRVGLDDVGEVIEYPLPHSGPWTIAGILDFSLAQMCYQLTRGCFWLPRLPQSQILEIPTTKMHHLIVENAPSDRQIRGKVSDPTGDSSAPFRILRPIQNPAPTYPALWAHEAVRERCMEVTPDSEARVRVVEDPIEQERINQMSEKIWRSATRIHHNRNFQYNSQSLAVSMVNIPSIGGRAWPSIIFPNEKRELWESAYAVWANSTLGILCHWWHADRLQGGRGSITIIAMRNMPTLDLRRLSAAQLAAAARLFADHKHLPMLPVNQIDEDENRAELDRRLLTEVLGLPASLCAGEDSPLALLRRKLAAEPSIHGGKKSKVVL